MKWNVVISEKSWTSFQTRYCGWADKTGEGEARETTRSRSSPWWWRRTTQPSTRISLKDLKSYISTLCCIPEWLTRVFATAYRYESGLCGSQVKRKLNSVYKKHCEESVFPKQLPVVKNPQCSFLMRLFSLVGILLSFKACPVLLKTRWRRSQTATTMHCRPRSELQAHRGTTETTPMFVWTSLTKNRTELWSEGQKSPSHIFSMF